VSNDVLLIASDKKYFAKLSFHLKNSLSEIKESMMKFLPCTGNCTEQGTHCEGCGRSHEEIAEMKKPVGELVALAKKMEYENVEEFANAVAGSLKYKLGAGH